jgi:hypothetical protein
LFANVPNTIVEAVAVTTVIWYLVKLITSPEKISPEGISRKKYPRKKHNVVSVKISRYYMVEKISPGLAFLPVSRVNDGVTYPQSIASPSALPLLQYSVQTCVSGDRIVGGVLCRRKATFKPETWNVYSETREESSRTNNFAEGWNNHFQHLVDHKHLTVWRLIEALQADAADVATKILQHSAGKLAPKRIDTETCSIQRRLKSLCDDLHAGQRTLTDFLQAVENAPHRKNYSFLVTLYLTQSIGLLNDHVRFISLFD